MTAPGGLPDRRSGGYAVLVGGIVIAVCVVVLAFLATVRAAIAVPVIVVDVLLFAGMLAARFGIRPVVRRQWTIAICLLAACVLSLAAVIAIGSLPR